MSTVTGSSHAAIPRESITVELRFSSIIARHTIIYEDGVAAWLILPEGEPETLRYGLTSGNTFWESSRLFRQCSAADVSKSIDVVSRRHRPVRIVLEVSDQTTLSTIAAGIEQVKDLAAANAMGGCKVEIVACPRIRRANQPKLADMREPSSSRAAAAKKRISVVFRGKLDVVRDPDIGELGYHLSTGGDVCSSAGTPPEVEIAETIDSSSRLYRSLCITMEVDQPDKTSFSDVAAAIEELKDLVAENVIDGCKIEIIVFPSTPHPAVPEPRDTR
jgi:hypothetical protein